ncbi:Agamous-like MADS-box protein AGL62 [Linum perenne]
MNLLTEESPSTALTIGGKQSTDDSNEINSSSSSSSGDGVLPFADRRGIAFSGRRRKIEIKKIEDQSSLFVAFSKRRNGLFGKLKKFLSLSPRGTQAAVITFSPAANKAHAFGYPAVEPVLRRFMDEVVAGGAQLKEQKVVEDLKMRKVDGRERMRQLEELEAGWLKFRSEVEKRMTEETIREVRTIKFFV